MPARSLLAALAMGMLAIEVALAQTPPAEPQAGRWRGTGGEQGELKPVNNVVERPSIAKVTKGSGTLPNDHGQIWREYDIRPYTTRVTTTSKPEQAIIDWILQETGYEAWHSDPLGLLSANADTLRCYHTPQVQAVVADIVDRFVSSEAETQTFGLRVVTVGNPNWRAKALRLMREVPVQTQGVQGWLLAKEDAALLMAELRRRSDYREHGSPHLLVNSGQSVVVSTIRPRTYVRGVTLTGAAWPGYQPEMGQIEEGFSLEFSPLMALDGGTVEAVLKLRLYQVEQMLPVMLEVPTPVAPRQRTRIEIPQMTMANLHERFRWPTDQVLLLSMGVVATPGPTASNPLTDVLPLPKMPDRADALLFIESKGKLTPAAAGERAARVESSGYPRRY